MASGTYLTNYAKNTIIYKVGGKTGRTQGKILEDNITYKVSDNLFIKDLVKAIVGITQAGNGKVHYISKASNILREVGVSLY